MPDELKIPAIGEYVRGEGTLIAIEDTQPPPIPPPTQDYIFEEITARCEVRLGDSVLNTFCSTWDFGGKGASVETAIKEAKKYTAANHIRPDSIIEVVVVKIVSRIRKQATDRASNYESEYVNFEPPSYGCRRGMPDDVEMVVGSSRTP